MAEQLLPHYTLDGAHCWVSVNHGLLKAGFQQVMLRIENVDTHYLSPSVTLCFIQRCTSSTRKR